MSLIILSFAPLAPSQKSFHLINNVPSVGLSWMCGVREGSFTEPMMSSRPLRSSPQRTQRMPLIPGLIFENLIKSVREFATSWDTIVSQALRQGLFSLVSSTNSAREEICFLLCHLVAAMPGCALCSLFLAMQVVVWAGGRRPWRSRTPSPPTRWP